MSLKTKLLTSAAGLAVAAMAMGAATWYFYLRSDAPAPVSLASALESIEATDGGAAGSTTASNVSEDIEVNLAGTWTVVAGANSFAGYRVDETLAGVGATTAVGRTSGVTGSLEFDGDAITSVEVTADLTTLASDKTMRDGQLRNQAIETSKFPTATFVLTSPIQISDLPADGETVTQTITGELTLHGVTNEIEVEVQGVLQNGQLVVVGSTEIQFADYDIAEPTSMSVVSIEDHGTMELQLVFAKA
jgi:polyisoprenoid-binding protein YceI